MAILIVEGGWASDDRRQLFIGWGPHAISGAIFYYKDSSKLLK